MLESGYGFELNQTRIKELQAVAQKNRIVEEIKSDRPPLRPFRERLGLTLVRWGFGLAGYRRRNIQGGINRP